MGLIETLKQNKNESNKLLVEELISFLIDANIDDLKELKKFEDLTFNVNGKVLNNKNRIKYCYDLVKNSFIDYDGLAFEEVIKIRKLKESLIENISDEKKIMNIIELHLITQRDIKFYVEAYNLAINGTL